MATKVKPQSKFAKEEAKLLTDHKRTMSLHGLNYDKERTKWGQPVADHNTGWLRGWDDGYAKGFRDAKAGKVSALARRHARSPRSKRK